MIKFDPEHEAIKVLKKLPIVGAHLDLLWEDFITNFAYVDQKTAVYYFGFFVLGAANVTNPQSNFNKKWIMKHE